jgi:hypothetical protein
MAADRPAAVTGASMSIAGRLTALEQARERAAMQPKQPDRPDMLDEVWANMSDAQRAEVEEALADEDDKRRAEAERDHVPQWVHLVEQAYLRFLEAQPREYWTERYEPRA